MTHYRSLQDCFYERLPESGSTSPDMDSVRDQSLVSDESVSPALSDEQVSLLATDLQTPLEKAVSD